jgi:hypothetical protein
MPVAIERLEHLQLLKLLQSVRNEDVEQIEKLVANGVPDLINLSGKEQHNSYYIRKKIFKAGKACEYSFKV